MTAVNYTAHIARLFDTDISRVLKLCEESLAVQKIVSGKLRGKNLWALTYDKRKALYAITRLLRPAVAVETGVGSGVSTTFLLSALRSGMLHSIDLGVKYGEEKEEYPVGFLVPERLKKKWHLHKGDARELLKPLLNDLGDIQLFYHDSRHTFSHVNFELECAWEHMERGIVLVDNYEFTRAPEKFADRVGAPIVRLSGRAGGFCAIPKGF